MPMSKKMSFIEPSAISFANAINGTIIFVFSIPSVLLDLVCVHQRLILVIPQQQVLHKAITRYLPYPFTCLLHMSALLICFTEVGRKLN